MVFTDVADLVRYNDAVRGLYFEYLAKLPWEEIVKPRGASFDSIRDVFLHLTMVEDRWVSYALVGRFSEWKDPVFDTYTDIRKLREYMTEFHANTGEFLQTLRPQDFQRTVVNPWIKDSSLTIETGLSHLVLECMVHFGEISALIWQMGKEAPYLAFLRYQLDKQK